MNPEPRTTLGSLLQPAIKVAEDGFPVDPTFRQQIADNFMASSPSELSDISHLNG